MYIKERYIDSKGAFMKRRLIVVFIACTVLLTPIFSFADSEGTETINSINTNISSTSNTYKVMKPVNGEYALLLG